MTKKLLTSYGMSLYWVPEKRVDMLRIYGVVIFLMLIMLGNVSASALSPVLITRLKTGENGFASREYVEVYNNGDQAQDLSGWCLVYSSGSDATRTTLGCLDTPQGNRLMLPAKSYVRFATSDFAATVSGFAPDVTFSAGISGSSGHVRLVNAEKQEIDKVAWGSAVSPEGQALQAHPSGKVFARLSSAMTAMYVDSNNNSIDFGQVTLDFLPSSSLFEERIVVDICLNIDGVQELLPAGFIETSSGFCVQDLCQNLDGLQENIPEDYVQNGDGACISTESYPAGSVLISEVLPNVSGSDTGGEFIELYNPTSSLIDLAGWRLELGPTYFKSYTFGESIIEPGSYLVLSDSDSGIVLPNSSAGLRLVGPDGSIVSEMPAYDTPRDDESWMFFEGMWQYGAVPTPGLANTVLIEEVIESGEDLEDCGPGKYRNPETNRCKSIEVELGLQPCAAGQERNPETNRCRGTLVASNVLVACKPGQERNPETNRCRAIESGANTLVPCAPGQERNPETNRCKKSGVLGAATLADVKDFQGGQQASGFSASWILIGLVLGAAVAYGVYEWRTEILRYFAKIRNLWPAVFHR